MKNKNVDLFKKYIQQYSTKEQKPFAGLSQDLKHKYKASSATGNDMMELLHQLSTGAESDNLDGLKTRLIRLDKMREYLLKSELSGQEQKTVYTAYTKVQTAVRKRKDEYAKKHTMLKGMLNEAGSSVASAAYELSAELPQLRVAMTLGGFLYKHIKKHNEEKKQKLKERQEQLRRDAELYYSRELLRGTNKPSGKNKLKRAGKTRDRLSRIQDGLSDFGNQTVHDNLAEYGQQDSTSGSFARNVTRTQRKNESVPILKTISKDVRTISSDVKMIAGYYKGQLIRDKDKRLDDLESLRELREGSKIKKEENNSDADLKKLLKNNNGPGGLFGGIWDQIISGTIGAGLIGTLTALAKGKGKLALVAAGLLGTITAIMAGDQMLPDGETKQKAAEKALDVGTDVYSYKKAGEAGKAAVEAGKQADAVKAAEAAKKAKALADAKKAATEAELLAAEKAAADKKLRQQATREFEERILKGTPSERLLDAADNVSDVAKAVDAGTDVAKAVDAGTDAAKDAAKLTKLAAAKKATEELAVKGAQKGKQAAKNTARYGKGYAKALGRYSGLFGLGIRGAQQQSLTQMSFGAAGDAVDAILNLTYAGPALYNLFGGNFSKAGEYGLKTIGWGSEPWIADDIDRFTGVIDPNDLPEDRPYNVERINAPARAGDRTPKGMNPDGLKVTKNPEYQGPKLTVEQQKQKVEEQKKKFKEKEKKNLRFWNHLNFILNPLYVEDAYGSEFAPGEKERLRQQLDSRKSADAVRQRLQTEVKNDPSTAPAAIIPVAKLTKTGDLKNLLEGAGADGYGFLFSLKNIKPEELIKAMTSSMGQGGSGGGVSGGSGGGVSGGSGGGVSGGAPAGQGSTAMGAASLGGGLRRDPGTIGPAPAPGQGSSALSNTAKLLREQRMETARSSGVGRSACVYAVNQVFDKAGVPQPWTNGTKNIDVAQAGLKKSGWIPVAEGDRQPGDVWIANNGPGRRHIGVVGEDGNVINNSSSRGSFANSMTPDGLRKEWGQGQYYRMPKGWVESGGKPGGDPSIPGATGGADTLKQDSGSASGAAKALTPGQNSQSGSEASETATAGAAGAQSSQTDSNATPRPAPSPSPTPSPTPAENILGEKKAPQLNDDNQSAREKAVQDWHESNDPNKGDVKTYLKERGLLEGSETVKDGSGKERSYREHLKQKAELSKGPKADPELDKLFDDGKEGVDYVVDPDNGEKVKFDAEFKKEMEKNKKIVTEKSDSQAKKQSGSSSSAPVTHVNMQSGGGAPAHETKASAEGSGAGGNWTPAFLGGTDNDPITRT